MFDLVSKRKWFFLASGLVILIGIISLIVSGLNVGLDFQQGITMTLVFSEPVEQDDLRATFADAGYPQAVIQHSPKEAFLLRGVPPGDKDALIDELEARLDTPLRTANFSSGGEATLALMFGKAVAEADLVDGLADLGYAEVSVEYATLDSFLVRVGELEEAASASAGAGLTEKERIKGVLETELGASVDFLDFDSISEAVASERVRYTSYAVLVASVGILLYIAWAFRRMESSFRFGVCAIVALVHDVLIVLTIFALFRLEVNAMFIIALMTVIGYGVNNIIVVFDRIRENRGRHVTGGLDTIVNMSITETITRSLNTSLTTLFVLLALLLFGGSTVYNFVLALTIGVIACTYSSLCIAAQLLVSWDQGDLGWLTKRIPLRRRRR